MGQKANPTVLRLDISKRWDFKFFEKKTEEFPRLTFRNTDIKDYIERFFQFKNLKIHECKINYSDFLINIYVSYHVTSNFIFKENITKDTEKNSTYKSNNQKLVKLASPSYNKKKHTLFHYKKSSYSNIANRILQVKLNKQFNKNSLLKKREGKNLKELELKNVFNSMLKGLSLVTENQSNIRVTLKCLNNKFFMTETQKHLFKEKLVMMQKFKNSDFFFDSVGTLYSAISNKNSADLISRLVSEKLKKIKRHKFFIAFLKRALTLMIHSTVSNISGIKIIIKGRLNGAPRARHKILNIGSVPTQTLATNIDYSESKCHNSNGTYGIKVWIVPK